MAVTLPWQIEWNSYLVGTGQPWRFAGEGSLDGFWDLPGVRSGDVERSRAHGSLPGPQHAENRVLTAALVPEIGTPLPAAARALAEAMALTDEPGPLVFRLDDDLVLRVNARVRRRSIPVGPGWQFGHTEATIQWVATDPRVYGDTLRSGSTGVGSVTGGLGFPHGFPHGFGTATAGTIATTNDGNETAPWIGTLTGPLTSPRIYLPAGGGNLEMIGFSLGSGETLVFDSLERTVLLNGTASRYGSLTSRQWFHMPVGSSTVALGAASGAGTLDLEYRDTWL